MILRTVCHHEISLTWGGSDRDPSFLRTVAGLQVRVLSGEARRHPLLASSTIMVRKSYNPRSEPVPRPAKAGGEVSV